MKKSDTKIVGILNITPDSYSDGGKYLEIDKALEHVELMIAQGVDLIDVGAESTRPNADFVTEEEEIKRLSGVLERIYKIARQHKVEVSLDSRNYNSLKKFADYYDIVNDVTGLRDEKIINFCVASGKRAIFMRSINVPVNPAEIIPKDLDVIQYVQEWLNKKLELLESKNLPLHNLIFDPGIGFGLGADKDLELIKRIDELNTHNVPIMLGYSRKSFLKKYGEDDASKRDPETHVITSYLITKNIEYIRLHNVGEAVRVMKLARELYK